MARINLITNPSFRNGLTGWEPVSDAVLSVETGVAFYGTGALLLEKSDSAGSGVATTDYIPVEPLKPYAVSAYARVPIGDPNIDIAIRLTWYTAASSIISEDVTSTSVVEYGDGWFRVTGVFLAPGAASTAKVAIIEPSAGNSGNLVYIDAVLLEQSSFVGGFVDNLSQAAENTIVNRALSRVPPSAVGGMDLRADITLGDLVLNTVDEDNTLWVCTDIAGWWNHADPDIPDIPRGVEDGSYEVTGRYQARQLVLSGTFIPSSVQNLGAARNRLIEAANLVRRGVWLRTNEEPTRAAFVRLSGRPQIETVNARGKTLFSIGLRAADPIKYEWNDLEPDGYTIAEIWGLEEEGEVLNKGTADVRAIFTLTGPLGVNSTVYNEATGETLTVVKALRGSNSVATVVESELFNNVATLTTDAPHGLLVGDVITVSGVGAPFDSVNETFLVTASSDEIPYTVSYDRVAIDRPAVFNNGSVGLAHNDVLEVDTYDRSVKFNGEIIGHRSKLETLTDWIRLAPGINTIHLDDSIDESTVIAKQFTSGVVTLTTAEAHFLSVDDEVVVALPETVELKRKSLTSNVATITTMEDHGFSVGDLVDVNSTEISNIVAKALTSNVVTLTTEEDGGFVAGDSITVALTAHAAPSQKAVSSNVVTITTATPHKYSTGDSVTMLLSEDATITRKAASTTLATITTSTTHGYSVGDSVTVSLPVSATITNKNVTGNSVTLTASAAHGFSVGDTVTVALPASATVSGARSTSGGTNHYATITTSAAHNFVVGDLITVDLTTSDTRNITNRASSGTTRTLTTSVAHGFVVGERITVSGVTSSYNGTFVIASVPSSTTLTYTGTSSLTESSVASSGAILNLTIQNGYNGSKVVEAVTSTTISYFAYGEGTTTGGTASGTVFNDTNEFINGTVEIGSVPSTTTFQYTN